MLPSFGDLKERFGMRATAARDRAYPGRDGRDVTCRGRPVQPPSSLRIRHEPVGSVRYKGAPRPVTPEAVTSDVAGHGQAAWKAPAADREVGGATGRIGHGS
jgi:hypothetical protein